MAEERLPVFLIHVGTNGGGKTHCFKSYLKRNTRNLVIPNSRDDKAWYGYPELKPEVRFERDVMDWKGKRMKPYWHIPKLSSFTGTYVIYPEDRAVFDTIIHPERGFKFGGLFIDDFKNYVPTTSNPPDAVRKFLGGRRQRMLDIFFAAWTFQDINAELYGFQTELVIHYVTRPPSDSVRQKVANYDELLRIHKHVNQVNLRLPENKRWYSQYFKPA